MYCVTREASYGPLRDGSELLDAGADERPINIDDFRTALRKQKSSVDVAELQRYTDWNTKFGVTF
jgi:SpoVK/Ycf46/Vps4 family AAA+-type ATPase